MGEQVNKESKFWVDSIVPKIVSTWDAELLIKSSSTELLKVTPREDFFNLFAVLSQELGPLKEYKRSSGEGGIQINNFSKNINAEYVIEAEFEKGSAEISIQGIRENGQWKISRFHVD